jgi:tetratricopeptide (TPR) repeat protein
VSVGLADILGKCLADDPDERYPHMAALAADLRRHLAHRPLAGVRNRSLRERWRKWRLRRPHGVALAGMMLGVLLAAGAVALGAVGHFAQRSEADGLNRRLCLAEQAQSGADRAAAVRELHRVSDRLRFLYGADHLSPDSLCRLAACCRAFWEGRGRIVERLGSDEGCALEPAVRDDLLDLAILWAELKVRLAPAAGREEARRQALTVLDEAEALFGPSPVLDEERNLHGAPGRSLGTAPATAWEHYALGRSLLRSGDLDRAAEQLGRAVRLQPQGLWPNFYQGLCAYRRGQYADALPAFSVCIGAAPEAAACFYNRALTFEALGRTEEALHDYDQALRLDPTLAAAVLNRGMLHYGAKRYAAALADLERARDLGADPAAVAFDLALVHLARGERAAALDNLCRALSHNLQQPDARQLYDSLLGR